ncbi:MAG TPA: arylesterase [Ohtaekwangia sp.]|uniref:arylesterase n=1 Tax=Ohtaekwangia sp. TaxID=2066019 RepID=UPI002F92DF54
MVGKLGLIISFLLLFQAGNSTKTILFYGDSLTAGLGVSPEEAFPALVEKKIKQQGKPCKVINAGLSGETSAGGVSRLEWVLRQPVDIFVLELGANDGLRGLPLDQTQKNLQQIIDKVKAKYPKAKIVLAGMMVPPNLGPDYTAKFKKMYPDLARKNSITLIPFLLQDVAGSEKLNQADGIHPNVAGHKIVAENVYKVIQPLL